jgi:glycerophosphoryl diester phosphodiesterase
MNDLLRGAWTSALCVALCALSGCATVVGEPEPFPRPFQIIAHRGASAYAPENTIPALVSAFELGAFEVEIDVQLSGDDVVILYHDANLEKKTSQPGRVRDHASDELTRMDIGSWFDRTHPEIIAGGKSYAGTTLASLDRVFEIFGSSLFYHIELKSNEPQLPELVVSSIRNADVQGRARVTSFQFDQLERVRDLDRDIPITLLIRRGEALRFRDGASNNAGANAGSNAGSIETLTEPLGTRPDDQEPAPLLPLQKDWIDRATAAGFDQVGIAAVDLSRQVVAYANQQGMQVRAWGIKGDEDMRRAIALGTHGMTTNWPDRLIRELVRHAGSTGARERVAGD